jgi:hypothetical protein
MFRRRYVGVLKDYPGEKREREEKEKTNIKPCKK